MKKLLILTLAALPFLFVSDAAEAQLFRRFRNNARSSATPQRAPQQYQPQYRAPANNVAPTYGQPQTMTPWSRLTPQQQAMQPNRTAPSMKAPTPINGQTAEANKDGFTRVRVVTYYDPRTGRTFQRRYLVPDSTASAKQVADTNGTNEPPSILNKQAKDDLASSASVSSDGQSIGNIPEFSRQSETRATQSTAVAGNDAMPLLMGPEISAAKPSLTAQATHAPSDDSKGESLIASSVESTQSNVEQASASIVESADAARTPADEASSIDAELFTDEDSEATYSVLE